MSLFCFSFRGSLRWWLLSRRRDLFKDAVGIYRLSVEMNTVSALLSVVQDP